MTTMDYTIKPHGLPAILAVYGNPFDYVNDKAAWETRILAIRPLRYPLPYAYADVEVARVRAHFLVVEELVEILAHAVETGVPRDRLKYGGCYCWRPIRGGYSLSLHTWGAAIDLDPMRNPLGVTWNPDIGLPGVVIDVFEKAGWTTGAHWSRPDPGHCQAASGY